MSTVPAQIWRGATFTIERSQNPAADAVIFRFSGPFTARDIHQRDWAGLSDREAVGAALDVLATTNHVRAVQNPPRPQGGRPSEAFTWHPSLKGGR